MPSVIYQLNDMAMAGKNNYNDNCHQQTMIMEASLPLFDKVDLGSNITIADYGCSQGGNSIPVMERVLARLPPSSSASLLFEDLPSNDYASLIKLLPKLSSSGVRIYPSIIPKSFYEPVVPPGTVDIGFTLSTLHWLKRMPILKPASETVDEYYDKRRSRNGAAAAEDFREFLTLRGEEIKKGGYLMIACFGTLNEDEVGKFVDTQLRHRILFRAAERLANMGKIPQSAMEKINAPAYDRSEEEFRAGIEEIGDTWKIDEYYRKIIPHPAYYRLLGTLENAKTEEEKVESRKAYAGVLIEWIAAVIGDMIKNWWRQSGVEEKDIDGIFAELIALAKDMLYEEGPGGAEIVLMFARLKRM